MEAIDLLIQNFLSPSILFFALGVISGLLKSDFTLPESVSKYIVIYILMANGFKAGAQLNQSLCVDINMFLTLASGLVFSFFYPMLVYFILKHVSKLDTLNIAAIAATFGGVSVTTFTGATSILESHNIVYIGYIIAHISIMKCPSIICGIYMSNWEKKEDQYYNPNKLNIKSLVFNGIVLISIGSLFIGYMTGNSGLKKLEGFLISPFYGMLCIFMLDMGLSVAKQIHNLKKFNISLVLFGMYMPVIGAFVALIIAILLGMDLGTGFVFMAICASSSYIAVPAAMKIAIPQAMPILYIPLAIGITFPFNLCIGLPIYFSVAKLFLAPL